MHMVTRSTVGANKNPGIQLITEFLPPKFKQTGCRKLIIVEVSMNKRILMAADDDYLCTVVDLRSIG